MDILHFNPAYSVLICTRCCFALVPTSIAAHLNAAHTSDVPLINRRTAIEAWDGRSDLSPASIVSKLRVSPQVPPIQYLSLYDDGIRCRLCPDEETYICRTRYGMRSHLRVRHNWRSPQGKGRQSVTARLAPTAYSSVVNFPVYCQTFYQQSQLVRFFQVASSGLDATINNQERKDPEAVAGAARLSRSALDLVVLQLDQQLQSLRESAQAEGLTARHSSQVDPWLDNTMWEQYLHGHDLSTTARLIALPINPAEDDRLDVILASFDRLIEQTRMLILKGEVNIFDLHRVNNFVSCHSPMRVMVTKHEKRAMIRPLLSKLLESTYKKYKGVWKRLLCFVYRLVYQQQQPALHYTLTDTQSTALKRLIRATEAINENRFCESGCRETLSTLLKIELDHACLCFCIALLDHRLLGPIYDSVIVGFLAVQGIDVKKNGFCEAACYTTHLSALVKMAQLLVLRQAIAAKEAGECEHPAQALEEMQERFMVYNTRSPMNWIQKLRTYGKRIRDTTTGLGHISWSDDKEELAYKELKLTMTGFKGFVLQQIKFAGEQLRSLLYMQLEEDTIAHLPELDLKRLKDNAAVKTPGWNFLCDPRNTTLQGYERWLLNRVISTDQLRKDFFLEAESARWRRPAAERYLKQVDTFLERLLLIAQLVSGQPARGSELMSLQLCNTIDCRRRNIFLENGLISFVTSYHKGYSVEGCVKIIHRYLPQEVSMLVVYYLWLVLPFANQLRMLALDQPATATCSPYLWSQPHKAHQDAGQYSPWPSSRLSGILKEEFQTYLHTKANIQIWRHAAIAISRQHLRQAKFRKDFDIGAGPIATWNDAQACHAADLAASVYARGIEEAPGHTEQARAEYRQISREWHGWLGVGPVPANPLPIFGRGFLGIKPGAKRATTWLDAQAGHTTDTAERIYARIGSSGSSLKRKALSDISGSHLGKKAIIRGEDKAEGVIRGSSESRD